MHYLPKLIFVFVIFFSISGTKQSFANPDETLKKLQDQIDDLKAKTDNLNDPEYIKDILLTAEEQKFSKLQTIESNNKKFISQQKTTLKEHEDIVKQNKETCESLKGKCSKLEIQSKSIEGSLDETKQQLSNLQKQNTDYQQINDANIVNLRSEIAQLKKELEDQDANLKRDFKSFKDEADLVYAKYTTSSSQSVQHDSKYKPLNFENKIHDTHNAVQVETGPSGKWAFTAPVDGVYFIYAQVHYAGTEQLMDGGIREWTLHVLKNGKIQATGLDFAYKGPGSQAATVHVASSIHLKSGDTISISGTSSINHTVNVHNIPSRSYVEIVRLGNSSKLP